MLAVYRNICRHASFIDPKLMGPIKAQFKRRRKHAKPGHLRAAEELERHMYSVAHGTRPIESLYATWQAPKKTAETNEASKRRLWQNLTHQRRLDRANIPPQVGTLEYARVHTAAQLYNDRSLVVRNLKLGSGIRSYDRVVVDTVLAPYLRKRAAERVSRKRLERESTPRRVQTKTFRRDGARIMILHTQGVRPPKLKFSALINAVNRNSRRCMRLRQKHTAADARRAGQFKEMQSAQYGVVLARASARQRFWDYKFKLKRQNRVHTPRPLRLDEL